MDPNQPGPYVIRAEILKRRNQLDQAIADATHALTLDPRTAAAFSIRAECRSAIGDVEGAGEDDALPAGGKQEEAMQFVRGRGEMPVPADFSQNPPRVDGLGLKTGTSSLPRETQISSRKVIDEQIQHIQFYDLREASARFLAENPLPQETPEAQHERLIRDDEQYRMFTCQLEARRVELHEKEVNERVCFNPAFRTLTAQLRQRLATLTEQRDALDAVINPCRSTNPTPGALGVSSSVQLLDPASEESDETSSLKELPLPGRKRGSWTTTLASACMIAGAGFGVTQFGRHIANTNRIITAPEEQPGSGIIVKSKMTDIWLSQAAMTFIEERLDPKALKSVETTHAYFNQQHQQELWLAVTYESQDKVGRTVRIPFVLYPSRTDDTGFQAFKAAVSLIIEKPALAPETGTNLSPTNIHILSLEMAESRDPMDAIRELAVPGQLRSSSPTSEQLGR